MPILRLEVGDITIREIQLLLLQAGWILVFDEANDLWRATSLDTSTELFNDNFMVLAQHVLSNMRETIRTTRQTLDDIDRKAAHPIPSLRLRLSNTLNIVMVFVLILASLIAYGWFIAWVTGV